MHAVRRSDSDGGCAFGDSCKCGFADAIGNSFRALRMRHRQQILQILPVLPGRLPRAMRFSSCWIGLQVWLFWGGVVTGGDAVVTGHLQSSDGPGLGLLLWITCWRLCMSVIFEALKLLYPKEWLVMSWSWPLKDWGICLWLLLLAGMIYLVVRRTGMRCLERVV